MIDIHATRVMNKIQDEMNIALNKMLTEQVNTKNIENQVLAIMHSNLDLPGKDQISIRCVQGNDRTTVSIASCNLFTALIMHGIYIHPSEVDENRRFYIDDKTFGYLGELHDDEGSFDHYGQIL